MGIALDVVLVEGLSDVAAIEAAARVVGRDLQASGVSIVPMGGATNIGRFLGEYSVGRHRLAVMCDAGEEPFFARALGRAGLGPADVPLFVCDRDLEDELIRALGVGRVESLIEGQGDLPSLRKLQQMPFHRGRPIEEHLHRFMGVRSGRKQRYAGVLAGALEPTSMPAPLEALLQRL